MEKTLKPQRTLTWLLLDCLAACLLLWLLQHSSNLFRNVSLRGSTSTCVCVCVAVRGPELALGGRRGKLARRLLFVTCFWTSSAVFCFFVWLDPPHPPTPTKATYFLAAALSLLHPWLHWRASLTCGAWFLRSVCFCTYTGGSAVQT